MDTKTLPLGTWLKNRYRVTRLVAGGGMAWVYEVEERRLDGSTHCWAMKELRTDSQDLKAIEEGRRLFEQEANILVGLSHPNLPQVIAYFELSGRSYLVMEFIRGESLEKRLEHANAPLMESQVLDWSTQVCAVLTYLHGRPQPIIFRDLKPSNIMVTPDGRIKLIDFGIARTYKLGKLRDTVSMGSENYAAPEQYGQAQTDPRADVYSLGATMYHLLTNVPPLPAFVPSPRVPIQHYNPAVTAGTLAAVDRAMANDRAERFQSAQEMGEALLECLPRAERRAVEGRLRQLEAQQPVQAHQASEPVARPMPAQATAPMPEEPTASQPRPAPASVPSASPPTGKRCPHCGAPNRPASIYCRRCGHRFGQPVPPVLRAIEPRSARWEFPLREGTIVIGRQGGVLKADLDVGFYDPEGFVSRNHARITGGQQRYSVADLGSSNGTFLNGRRLASGAEYPLREGDRIRLGQMLLEFHIR